MKPLVFLVALILISCPHPAIKEIPELDYLREAASIRRADPIRAYRLLAQQIASGRYAAERNSLILDIYLDQREYKRAVDLLDSTNWAIPITPEKRDLIFLKTGSWQHLAQSTDNELLRGTAFLNLNAFDNAIASLSVERGPEDYRLIQLARAYLESEKYEEALRAMFRIGSVRDYLFDDYQEVLFDILLGLPDLNMVEAGLTHLKDRALREYVRLRMYEKEKAKGRLTTTAWKLINDHPKTPGAYYALRFVKPKTRAENKAYGRVLYYNNEYTEALKYLKRGIQDETVNYYLGRIYYTKKDNDRALSYLSKCSWGAAYYYRGRVYERKGNNTMAISIYDSLRNLRDGSEYSIRGQKRKAFLLEEIGDTLNAVETFLDIDERNTNFRAAMQLLRIGDLKRALTILERKDEPEFIYWQMRSLDRLDQNTDSLRQYLPAKYPLSYYALVNYDHTNFLDTLPLNIWMSQFADTLVAFTKQDSIHMYNAVEFFQLNENEHAVAELKMVSAQGPQDLVFLSKLCAQYGEDKQSIRYALQVKRPAAKKNILKLPVELLRLQYPIRYAFTIAENYPELSLTLAMIWQESLFDPLAVSPANARGLMQIIPATARTIARDLGVADYSYKDPAVSIRFGTHYFKEMMNEFNSVPLSLAAYNAGPVRVRRWIRYDPNAELEAFVELIPYDETRNYVKSILGRREIYRFLINGQ
ncbi:MAG: lytic transglycosylase domain-containing protein [candidate division WOR-3 bacterium]|nr:MAG: lytic transglycosylase domain-containing protein [candidate division WOR-3 bacterium]